MESTGQPQRVISDSELEAIGIRDIPRAHEILLTLRGWGPHAEAFDEMKPALVRSLSLAPDPDMALINLDRWQAGLGNRLPYYRFLAANPRILEIFCTVCATSVFFSEILISQPELFDLFADPELRARTRTTSEHYREMQRQCGLARSYAGRMDALRRYKRREVLRIGVMDILGALDLPQVTRALSDFADAACQCAYELARDELLERYGGERAPHLAVIAMGKHGGRELNYSSDIDLVFVHQDDPPPVGRIDGVRFSERLAQEIVRVLSEPMERGFVFRVDLRLRPEGRFGAPSRSIGSCVHYYETWAESWERQALIKSRFVAGYPPLGDRWRSMAQAMAYPPRMPAEWLEEIRYNKRRIEQQAAMEQVTETNVKIGRGGIRDVEFTVQLLQLRHGGARPRVRQVSTLDALAALQHEGLISSADAANLDRGYRFLRTVEHRLQILYEQQTQRLPTEPRARALLARRMGFDTVEAFEAQLAFERDTVHEIYQRLFYADASVAPLEYTEALQEWAANLHLDAARTQMAKLLASMHFRDTDQALRLIARSTLGNDPNASDMASSVATPDTRRACITLLPALLDACRRSPWPDRALMGIEALADAVPNRAHLYETLAADGDMLRRLADIAGASPMAMQVLTAHQELLDVLFSDETHEPAAATRAEMAEQLAQRLPRRGDPSPHIAAFIRRERLRIIARDVWGEASGLVIASEITALYEAVLEALLKHAIVTIQRELPQGHQPVAPAVAVLGMGKFGGQELGYSSDLDILFTHTHPDGMTHADAYQYAAAVANHVLALCRQVQSHGVPLDVDARLRPEGRYGAISRLASDYLGYYRERGDTWERQALTRLRPVCGDPSAAQALMDMAAEVTYGRGLEETELRAIQHMKRRIETERLRPDRRETDVKLGYGGVSDIEFTVQMLQLRHGHERPSIRHANTVQALHALRAEGLVSAADARNGARCYHLCAAIRNAMNLVYGAARDHLPDTEQEQEAVARLIGVTEQQGSHWKRLMSELTPLMRDVRQWTVRELYGGVLPE